MIIKSLTRKDESYSQLIRYILQDAKDISEASKKSFVIRHHIKGDTLEDITKEFQENERYRINKRSNNSKIFHTIMSFSDKDRKNLTLEKMKNLTQSYIQLRSPNAMVLAVPHFEDKKNWHCHLIFSGVEYRTGKSIRISREEFKKTKVKIQAIQIERYPELTESLVDHDRDTKDFRMTGYQKGTSEKTELKSILNTCYNEALSKVDFFRHLKAYDLETYIRGGIITGVWFQGRKYRLKKFGITQEVLSQLDKEQGKLNDLKQQRGKSNHQDIDLKR
ncbi:MAG: relaxase/mobilization nuclease domain-containing protein [Bacteroidetes bacterium]|nr:relaxase/mobilization nuclease domain-containing protein [Bacteroidota bacterium]